MAIVTPQVHYGAITARSWEKPKALILSYMTCAVLVFLEQKRAGRHWSVMIFIDSRFACTLRMMVLSGTCLLKLI